MNLNLNALERKRYQYASHRILGMGVKAAADSPDNQRFGILPGMKEPERIGLVYSFLRCVQIGIVRAQSMQRQFDQLAAIEVEQTNAAKAPVIKNHSTQERVRRAKLLAGAGLTHRELSMIINGNLGGFNVDMTKTRQQRLDALWKTLKQMQRARELDAAFDIPVGTMLIEEEDEVDLAGEPEDALEALHRKNPRPKNSNRDGIQKTTFRYDGDPAVIAERLEALKAMETSMKVNLKRSYFLRANDDDQRFLPYHDSHGWLFDAAKTLSSRHDIDELIHDHIMNPDSLFRPESEVFDRPNTRWSFYAFWYVEINVWPLTGTVLGAGVVLPKELKHDRSIVCNDGRDDQLCMMRCLAIQVHGCKPQNCDAQALLLFKRFWSLTNDNKTFPTKGIKKIVKEFRGVDLWQHEDAWNTIAGVNVDLFTRHGGVKGQAVLLKRLVCPGALKTIYVHVHNAENSLWESTGDDGETILQLHDGSASQKPGRNSTWLDFHASPIIDLGAYGKTFACSTCGTVFASHKQLTRHGEEVECSVISRLVLPAEDKIYEPRPDIFSRCAEVVGHPVEKIMCTGIICWDMEAMLQPLEAQDESRQLQFSAIHVPLSVAVISNIEGYTAPRCFISNGNVGELIWDMVAYMRRIATSNYHTLSNGPYKQLIAEMREKSREGYKNKQVLNELLSFIRRVPCLSHNGARYDHNLVKGWLFSALEGQNEWTYINSSAGCEQWLAEEGVETRECIIGGHRVDGFKASTRQVWEFHGCYWHGCPQCYPSRELKGRGGILTFGQLHDRTVAKTAHLRGLGYEVIEKWECQFHLNPDTKTDGFRVSNQPSMTKSVTAYRTIVSRSLIFLDSLHYLSPGTSMAQFTAAYTGRREAPFPSEKWFVDEQQLDLTLTQIPVEAWNLSPKDHAKMCKAWELLGCGTLRGWFDNYCAMSLKMPYCYDWMDSISKLEHTELPSRDDFFNKKDNKACSLAHWIHAKKIWADNHMKTFREFTAFYNVSDVVGYLEACVAYAGLLQKKGHDPYRDAISLPGVSLRVLMDSVHVAKESLFLLTERDRDIYEMLRNSICGGPSLVFSRYAQRDVTRIRCRCHDLECYKGEGVGACTKHPCSHKLVKRIIGLDASSLYLYCIGQPMPFGRPVVTRGELNTTDREALIKRIADGSFCGFLECDVLTPEHLKEMHAEFPMVFKSCEVPCESAFMRGKYSADELKPTKKLISSYFGARVCLYSDLAKFYIQHGLEISAVYRMAEYTASRCLERFVQEVAQSRREGDADTARAPESEVSKLLGNSAVGKTITDLTKHRKVSYVHNQEELGRLIRRPQFTGSLEMGEGNEVESLKSIIKQELPCQLGIAIYGVAKRRMLELYYDFLLRFVDTNDFQLLQMDTDSLYMAISGSSLDAVIKTSMRAQYELEKTKWFPDDSSPESFAFSKRTPGLFKEEWSGIAFCALTSKMYCGVTEDQHTKLSAKGIQKSNTLTIADYLACITGSEQHVVTNQGFRAMPEGSLRSYVQRKKGLSGVYLKRRVTANGMDTDPSSY